MMNEENHQLDRLLSAAARAPQREVPPASFTLEAKTLASWRSARSMTDTTMLVSWFRRAVACACLLMLASLVWGYSSSQADTSNGNEPISIADSALTLALNQ